MAIPPHDRPSLDGFLNAIKSNLAGYKNASFSFCAVRYENKFQIIQGQLLLQHLPLNAHPHHFESKNIKAGIYSLEELKMTPERFIMTLFSGTLPTPDGDLFFPPQQNGFHSLYLVRYGPLGTRQSRGKRIGPRHVEFFIRGEYRNKFYHGADFDWELKASSRPFDRIQDLCDEYGVGAIDGNEISVKLIAANVVSLATDSSITGQEAKLAVLLADGLDREAVSLGYNVLEKGKSVKRHQISGANMHWTESSFGQRGDIRINVPVGSVIECNVGYAGEVQYEAVVIDASVIPNPRRAALQTFDRDLKIFLNQINKSYPEGKTKKEKDARDLEASIAWLFWMLGFSVTHIGNIPEINNAPDLIVTTPQGNLAVIECTTGILKEEHKLTRLVERGEKVRQSLISSGHNDIKVLPIIVTTKTRNEILVELEPAQNSGVYVIAREDLEKLIADSSALPNADDIYANAERSLVPAKDNFFAFNP